VPGFKAGFIAGGAAAAGDAFPQAEVRMNGRDGLFDDVVGRGFVMLTRNGDPTEMLSPADHAFWMMIGGKVVRLDENGAIDGMNDAQGLYTRLMDEHACDVLIKRPDYYMFGACRSAELPFLIADLRRQLGHDPEKWAPVFGKDHAPSNGVMRQPI
jgi:hypothetical protein